MQARLSLATFFPEWKYTLSSSLTITKNALSKRKKKMFIQVYFLCQCLKMKIFKWYVYNLFQLLQFEIPKCQIVCFSTLTYYYCCIYWKRPFLCLVLVPTPVLYSASLQSSFTLTYKNLSIIPIPTKKVDKIQNG